MPVAVLRAVVSTPRVPVLVIRHEPRRQPSADVVVVAGAAGAAPVGDAPVGAALVGVVLGVVEVDEPELGDVLAEAAGVLTGEVGDADEDDEPREPVWPQTAPAMSPTTAAIARETSTIAPAGIDPRSCGRIVITCPP